MQSRENAQVHDHERCAQRTSVTLFRVRHASSWLVRENFDEQAHQQVEETPKLAMSPSSLSTMSNRLLYDMRLE